MSNFTFSKRKVEIEPFEIIGNGYKSYFADDNITASPNFNNFTKKDPFPLPKSTRRKILFSPENASTC
jgi:hypothetical protein